MMSDDKNIPFFKYGTWYDAGTRVKKQGTGFGAPIVYGVIATHDFFGQAVPVWEDGISI